MSEPNWIEQQAWRIANEQACDDVGCTWPDTEHLHYEDSGQPDEDANGHGQPTYAHIWIANSAPLMTSNEPRYFFGLVGKNKRGSKLAPKIPQTCYCATKIIPSY